MSVNFKILFLVVHLGLCSTLIEAANISGRLELDDSWEPVVYLSLINSFDDLNTASYEFLIAKAEIDSLGYFEMNKIEIPADDRLYRLHICKKGDPVPTIIIGSADENFIHFIMKNSDSITILWNKDAPEFHSCLIEGNRANTGLAEVFRLHKDLLSPSAIPSVQNRELRRKKVLEDYRNLADTSSFAIIKLLSMYMISESFVSEDQLNFMEEVQGKLHDLDTSSPYYQDFKDKLGFLKFRQKTTSFSEMSWFLLIGIALIVIAGIILFLRSRKTKKHTNNLVELLSQLSVQERRVLDLLKEGKSNKEIAQELHIEVSTVKSHLNKIYSRLGVKSRKEILHREWGA
jgi:LPXTG-motif cell wall-anchored protein